MKQGEDLMGEYRYTAYFEPLAEGGYNVVFPAIPEICTFGRTLEEARCMAVDALRCHLEGLAKEGETFPIDPVEAVPITEKIAVSV